MSLLSVANLAILMDLNGHTNQKYIVNIKFGLWAVFFLIFYFELGKNGITKQIM